MRYLPLILLLTGCVAKRASSEDKMELSLHKVRTELEDLKHDLNTYEIEHHVLEGKVVQQDASLVSLKREGLEPQIGKLEKLSDEIASLEKRISQLAKQQDKLIADIRHLSTHANDTTTALSQYKEKIAEFEKALFSQKISYTVRQNDTLEKIAKNFKVTTDELKVANRLSGDVIHPGQQLTIPSQDGQ